MLDRRILHLIPRLCVTESSIPIGGSAASLASLTDRQRQQSGYEVGVITGCRPTDGSLSTVLGSEVSTLSMGMRSVPVTYRYGMEFIARSTLLGATWARRFDPGLVHGHSGRWHYSLATYLLSRKLRSRWVHSLYCPVSTVSGPFASLFRGLLGRADAITGISRNVVDSVARIGVARERIHHIDPCIDLARYQPRGGGDSVRARLGLPDDGAVLLFVGNPTPEKGFDVLWHAFRDLRRTLDNVHLVATFEWHGRSRDRDMSTRFEEVKDSNVRFLGVVDDMPALMEAADVLVAPFRSTAGPSDYPLPVLEAMAVGTLVVTSDVGGISEVVKHRETGMLVTPDAVAELTGVLEELLTDRSMWSTLSGAARELVQHRFSPQTAAENWNSLYEGL